MKNNAVMSGCLGQCTIVILLHVIATSFLFNWSIFKRWVRLGLPNVNFLGVVEQVLQAKGMLEYTSHKLEYTSHKEGHSCT